MRGKSHRHLGIYLADRYLMQIPQRYRTAFILGCVEPDRNPFTYLKGSFQHAWLRGHNYRNASKFMRKLSIRLEGKEQWNIWDYYSLGKLIHYTADAFTQAHNENFPGDLDAHRNYEAMLQHQFLSYLDSNPEVEIPMSNSIMEAIICCHADYSADFVTVHNDVRYALTACCCILALLFTCRIV